MLGSEQITRDAERDEREREREREREGREFILFYFFNKTRNEILVLMCITILLSWPIFWL